jgi:uncharacterized protein (DUF2164 family)
MIRKWDISDDQNRKKCIEEILTRLDEQGEADFGVIAAQDIIDIVSQHLGPEIYNLGIEEAKKAIQSKLADLDVDLDILKASN